MKESIDELKKKLRGWMMESCNHDFPNAEAASKIHILGKILNEILKFAPDDTELEVKVELAHISIKDLKPEELEKLKNEWVKERSKILDYTEEELRKIRWMQGTYEDR